jgi:hypothetical protein
LLNSVANVKAPFLADPLEGVRSVGAVKQHDLTDDPVPEVTFGQAMLLLLKPLGGSPLNRYNPSGITPGTIGNLPAARRVRVFSLLEASTGLTVKTIC